MSTAEMIKMIESIENNANRIENNINECKAAIADIKNLLGK